MTPEQFAYWLQGFMEIQDPTSLSAEQTQIIKDHLALVFEKKTPDRKITKVPNAKEQLVWEPVSMPPQIEYDPFQPICTGHGPDRSTRYC